MRWATGFSTVSYDNYNVVQFYIVVLLLLQNTTISLKLLHVFVVATASHARTNAEGDEDDDNVSAQN
jgi:hypothetical protein